jgi:tRNA1(Val) A37 N6-methylase TrmN6
VTAAIASRLGTPARSAQQVVRLLDPCAGTGEAAARLAGAVGAESYGIELHAPRADAARERLDRVLQASAFGVRLSNGAFSCLFLNPPYADDVEHRRLEHAFLTALTRALAPDGLLIFIIPERRLGVSACYLASQYSAIEVFRLPDPEYAAFSQVVLFARRKARPLPEAECEQRLVTWG